MKMTPLKMMQWLPLFLEPFFPFHSVLFVQTGACYETQTGLELMTLPFHLPRARILDPLMCSEIGYLSNYNLKKIIKNYFGIVHVIRGQPLTFIKCLQATECFLVILLVSKHS